VVRSARMPREMQDPGDELEMQTSPPMHQEPYQDSPPTAQGGSQASAGAESSRNVSSEVSAQEAVPVQPFNFGFDGTSDAPSARSYRPSQDTAAPSIHPAFRAEQPGERGKSIDVESYRPSGDTGSRYDRPSSEQQDTSRYRNSEVPSLGPIQSVGNIDLPSRFNSRRSANLDDINSGDATSGQDWLRAVDELDWNHDHAEPAPVYQPSASTRTAGLHSPNVPRRSSRRTPSQDITPGRGHDDVFEGFDSGRTSPDYLSAPPHDERPTSYASVGHHRAADSISRNSLGANAARHGTSAELFGKSPEQGGHF